MQKTLGAIALVALMALTSPLASASVTFDDALHVNDALLTANLKMPASTPIFQSSKQYDVTVGTGDTISATLTYTNAATAAVGNDLDLTLLVPSAAPVPLPIPPDQATILAIAGTRVARTTCTDAAAQSTNHPALGEPTGEALSFTVPAGGEVGKYALVVRGLFMTTDQPYT
ncbi:MAG: hypothetical protein LC624_02080, partial [Halobacteriales archaeon]|nr:hypothetical protein [Halobacteriales archaeon]